MSDIDGILFNEIENAPDGLSLTERLQNASKELKCLLEPENANYYAPNSIETEVESRVCELEEKVERSLTLIEQQQTKIERLDKVVEAWKREAENQYQQVRFHRFGDVGYPKEGALDATIKEALAELKE